MFERTKLLLDKEKIDNIINTSVLIVGIGGVGGITSDLVARLGVGNIYIVDYDKFEISNLNRQILSLRSNVGEYKVNVAKKRILDINDKCNVTTYNTKLDQVFLDNFNADVDYIIDACDDINAKVLLVKYAITNNIKIISCCGTGNRIDPTKLTYSTIWKTEDDPLSKKFRYELRNNNITYKLPVVYSKEHPIKTKESVGSVSMVPNAAGILLASYVLNDIMKGND